MAFVIWANSNHWIVLTNIDFVTLKYEKENPGSGFQMDDDFGRTNCFFYDSLNDDKHAFFCSKVLEKVFPDQTGCKVFRVDVQQQSGSDDCGLFACAYLELLSQAQDPANFTFNQENLRTAFNNYLVSNSFDGFSSVYHVGVPNVSRLTIDWTHSWSDRCEAIRDHHRHQEKTLVDIVTL